MKRKLTLVTILFAALGGTVLCARTAAQIGPPTSQQSQAERDMLDRQAKEANKKRQQDIRDETEKLYRLSTELKEAVEKSNENLLSIDVIRKAEEVEKLAKKVKDKMKEAIGPPPRSPEPPVSIPGRPPQ